MVFVTLYIGGLLLHAGYHVVGDKMRSGETHKADSFFVIDREAYGQPKCVHLRRLIDKICSTIHPSIVKTTLKVSMGATGGTNQPITITQPLTFPASRISLDWKGIGKIFIDPVLSNGTVNGLKFTIEGAGKTNEERCADLRRLVEQLQQPLTLDGRNILSAGERDNNKHVGTYYTPDTWGQRHRKKIIGTSTAIGGLIGGAVTTIVGIPAVGAVVGAAIGAAVGAAVGLLTSWAACWWFS